MARVRHRAGRAMAALVARLLGLLEHLQWQRRMRCWWSGSRMQVSHQRAVQGGKVVTDDVILKLNDRLVYKGPRSGMPTDIRSSVERMERMSDRLQAEVEQTFADFKE